VEVHPVSEEAQKGMFVIKDRMDTKKIPIESIRWSYHGTGGQ